MTKVDILAFGAHPDDVEIGAGGTLAREVSLGRRVGIVDLTCGEMSTNGTPEERHREAVEAARILGAEFRRNLGLPDRGITVNQGNIARVVEVIRRYTPDVVLAPHPGDRHPDHARCAELVREAFFSSGLARFDRGSTAGLPPHRPRRLYLYFVSSRVLPSFVVDVSDWYEVKWRSLQAHRSQFGFRPAGKGKDEANKSPTYVNETLPGLILGRDRYFGALIGACFGEGFFSPEMLEVGDLLQT